MHLLWCINIQLKSLPLLCILFNYWRCCTCMLFLLRILLIQWYNMTLYHIIYSSLRKPRRRSSDASGRVSPLYPRRYAVKQLSTGPYATAAYRPVCCRSGLSVCMIGWFWAYLQETRLQKSKKVWIKNIVFEKYASYQINLDQFV